MGVLLKLHHDMEPTSLRRGSSSCAKMNFGNIAFVCH